MVSVNRNVMDTVYKLIRNAEVFGCRYFKLEGGTHVVDMGIDVAGGWEAAKLFTEIDMACLAKCEYRDFPLDEDISVSSVEIYVDNPELACIASQIATFQLSEGEFSMIGSGPARALAVAGGDEFFKKTSYRDIHGQAVIGITSNVLPDEALAEKIAAMCKIKTEDLYILVHSYNSIVCNVQVSARIVEQTINQMNENGFDLHEIVSARGYCAVAPIAPDDFKAMGWVNDCLLYGGKSIFWVRSTDEEIKEILPKLVTENSKDYGRLFIDLFEEAGRDFYAMDLGIHSPAMVQIYNVNSGNVFTEGSIRKDILKKSFFNL